ncbi:MAG: hypothetical protein IPK60_16500 [Sandaracinaceae bacterium]|nr:hypothetical protein [Sandaracinaceae bacterium]
MKKAWRKFLMLSLVTAACLTTCTGALVYQATQPLNPGSPPGGGLFAGSIMVCLFVGLPLQIMGYVDVVRFARSMPPPEKRLHRIGLLVLGAPVFLGGVVVALMGISLSVVAAAKRSPIGIRVGFIIVAFGVSAMGFGTRKESDRSGSDHL